MEYVLMIVLCVLASLGCLWLVLENRRLEMINQELRRQNALQKIQPTQEMLDAERAVSASLQKVIDAQNDRMAVQHAQLVDAGVLMSEQELEQRLAEYRRSIGVKAG